MRSYLLQLFALCTLFGIVLHDDALASGCDCELPEIEFYGSFCVKSSFNVTLNGVSSSWQGENEGCGSYSTAERPSKVQIEPNKQYTVTISGSGVGTVHVAFSKIPPCYQFLINGVERASYDDNGQACDGPYNGQFTVELRSLNPGGGTAGDGTGGLNSVRWEWSLGKLASGASAGGVFLNAETIDANVYSPDALLFSTTASDEVTTSFPSPGVREILAPETKLVVTTVDPLKYTMAYHERSGGVANPTPFTTWTVENPDGSGVTNHRLRITKAYGINSEVFEYEYTAATGIWTYTTGNGLRVETLERYTVDPALSGVVEDLHKIRTIKNGAAHPIAPNAVVSQTHQVFRTFTATLGTETLTFQALIESTEDPNGVARKTQYEYYTDPADLGNYRNQKWMIDPFGNWERLEYHSDWTSWGKVSAKLQPWKNLPAHPSEADSSNCVRTQYYYGGYGSPFGNKVSWIYKYVLDAPTEQTWFTYPSSGGKKTWRYPTSSTSVYLISETSVHNAGNPKLEGRTIFSTDEQGLRSSYAYDWGTFDGTSFTVSANGPDFREMVTHGTTTSTSGIAGKTTREVIIYQGGKKKRHETQIYNGGSSYLTATVESFAYTNGLLTEVRKDGRVTLEQSWVNGRLDFTINESGTKTVFGYDALGRVTTATKVGVTAGTYPAQSDIVTTTILDAVGRALRTTTSAGGLSLVSEATYNPAGEQTSNTDEGIVTTMAKTVAAAGGSIETTTRPGSITEVLTSYRDGQLKSRTGTGVVAEFQDYIIESNGNRTTQRWFGSESSPRWSKSTSDWAGQNVENRQPAFSGERVKTNIYNTKGQMTKQTNSGYADTLFVYDALGRPTLTGYDLDANGILDLASLEPITEGDRSFQQISSTWHDVDTRKVYPTDNSSTPATVTTTRRQLSGLATDTLLRTEELDLNSNSIVTTVTVDRAAKAVTSTTEFPDSALNAVAVTVNGLRQTQTDGHHANGTQFGYDALGRANSVTSPAGVARSVAFELGTGRLASETDANGSTVYDYYPSTVANAGRVKSITRADGKKEFRAYTARGELFRQWGHTVYPTEYIFDSYGQNTQLITFRNDLGWTGTDWPSGATGDATIWAYQESTGHLLNKEDAAGQKVEYEYEAGGRIFTRKWARNLVTTYSYHPTGPLTGVDYSDSTPDVSYTLDRTGNVKTATQNGSTRTYMRNALGQAKEESIAGGPLNGVVLEYPPDTFLRPGAATLKLGGATVLTHTPGYDTQSRLQTVGDGIHTIEYQYEPSGRLDQLSYKTDGTQKLLKEFPSYDGLSRIESINYTPTAGGVASHAYLYDNVNRRTRHTVSDGSRTEYGYNDRNEVTSAKRLWSDGSDIAGQQFASTYDPIGNRLTETVNGRLASYTPNNLNQYSGREVPGAVDVFGNAKPQATVTINNLPTLREAGGYFYRMLGVSNVSAPVLQAWSVTGVRKNAGPDGKDVISSHAGETYIPQTPESFSYDLDGDMLTNGQWQYTWNGENRLIAQETLASVPVGGKRKLAFEYDEQGRRIKKIVYDWNAGTQAWDPAKETRFVYQGWNLMAELSATGALERSYLWGLDLSGTPQGAGGVGGLLAGTIHTGTSASYFTGSDANGNVVLLVNAADGGLVDEYRYSAFGELFSVNGLTPALPFLFSTKYRDAESLLYYYGFRYYEPVLGRWLSRDPIEESGGLNLHAFVLNNPFEGVDILGFGTYRLGNKMDPHPAPDIGAGPWNTMQREKSDDALWWKWKGGGIGGYLAKGADASKHMQHYLGNTGAELVIRLKEMVENSSEARKHFYNEANDAMAFAELQSIGQGPGISYGIVGSWTSGYNGKDNQNWLFAVGGYSGAGKGDVKFLGSSCYEMTFTFNFYDRYNWDYGKYVKIAGKVVDDAELGRLHLVGLAKEFDMTGMHSISIKWVAGQRFDEAGKLSEVKRPF